jgi:hypothetical protein
MVRGSGHDDLWILRNVSSIAHWDGTAWTDLSIDPSIGSHAWSVWVSGPNEAWLGAAIPLPVGPDLIQRTQPAIYRLQSGAWSKVASPIDSLTDVYLNAMWGSGPNDVWAGGDKVGPTTGGHTFISAVLLHWDGSAWTSFSPAAMQRDGQIIGDLWGTSSHDVWAAGGGAGSGIAELWHYDGSDWTETAFSSPLNGSFGGLWGSCPSELLGLRPGAGRLERPAVALRWNSLVHREPSNLRLRLGAHDDGSATRPPHGNQPRRRLGDVRRGADLLSRSLSRGSAPAARLVRRRHGGRRRRVRPTPEQAGRSAVR